MFALTDYSLFFVWSVSCLMAVFSFIAIIVFSVSASK